MKKWASSARRPTRPWIPWTGWQTGVQWKDTVTQPVDAMWHRGHNPGMPKGTEYVDVLGSSIRNQGGKICYETTAHTLLTDDNGAVNGVVCQQTDGTNAAAE